MVQTSESTSSGLSPTAAMAVMRVAAETDVSDVHSPIRGPTLVIPCKDGTPIPIECGRFIARNIPGARLIELPGQDHLFFIQQQIGDCKEEFVAESLSGAESHRVLATVLFTDIVHSTARAEQIGDQRWHDLLDAHHRGKARTRALPG